MIVGVEISLALRIELFHPGNLTAILGYVRLQVSAGMLRPQSAGHVHLLRRAGCREPRRYAVELTSFAVPFSDQRFRFVVTSLRGISQCLGAVSIHHDFASNHAHVERRGLLEEGIDRLRM